MNPEKVEVLPATIKEEDELSERNPEKLRVELVPVFKYEIKEDADNAAGIVNE